MNIAEWLPMLRAAAGRMIRLLPSCVDRADLEQAAAERLVRYGIANNDANPAYVWRHAQMAMVEELRRNDPMGRDVRRLLRRVDAAGHALLSEGKRPTAAAIAERVGVTAQQVQAATDMLSRASELRAEYPVLDKPLQPDSIAERKQSAEVLAQAVANLPPAQREVMRAALHGESPPATAERLGIPYHTVRKRQEAATKLLRLRLQCRFG